MGTALDGPLPILHFVQFCSDSGVAESQFVFHAEADGDAADGFLQLERGELLE